MEFHSFNPVDLLILDSYKHHKDRGRQTRIKCYLYVDMYSVDIQVVGSRYHANAV